MPLSPEHHEARENGTGGTDLIKTGKRANCRPSRLQNLVSRIRLAIQAARAGQRRPEFLHQDVSPFRHRGGHAGSRSTPLCNTRKLTLTKGRDACSRTRSLPSILDSRESLTRQTMTQVTTDLKVIDSHAARKERQQNGQPESSVQLCANPSERQITPNFVEQPASNWPPMPRREQTVKPARTRTGW